MQRNKTNVLIYPSGGENAVNIYNALKYNLHFELFGASMSDNHSKFIYDKNHYFEGNLDINNPFFFDVFNEVLKKFKIKYILCTHDEVTTFLMKNEERIKATLCCSPLETAIVASDKLLTSQTFKNKYYSTNIYNDINHVVYPAFLKPFHGAGGKGTIIVNNETELRNIINKNSEYLICEYLPGNEYTVDCFTNCKGDLIFAQGRTRERIIGGLPYRIEKVQNNKKFLEIAKDINKTLRFRGAWYFQLKEDKQNNLKLMEICVRQGGSMNYYRGYGFNFPAMTLFDFMGNDIIPIMNNYSISLDRCLHNSSKINYTYDKIYIDFDDTIIVDNKVNSTAIKFLYQSLNKKKKIYLLTRHSKNIIDSLRKYNIDIHIFEDIINLSENEQKSDKIDNKQAIFIDNYFKERYEVYNNIGIPVFDVDAIEFLIDDSEL